MCTEIAPGICEKGSDCLSCMDAIKDILGCTAADITAVCGSGPTPGPTPSVNITNIDWRTSNSV